MLEAGPARILYSVDYLFEDMSIAAEWLDKAAISDADRLKIAAFSWSKAARDEGFRNIQSTSNFEVFS
jgi:hypothetical protein